MSAVHTRCTDLPPPVCVLPLSVSSSCVHCCGVKAAIRKTDKRACSVPYGVQRLPFKFRVTHSARYPLKVGVCTHSKDPQRSHRIHRDHFGAYVVKPRNPLSANGPYCKPPMSPILGDLWETWHFPHFSMGDLGDQGDGFYVQGAGERKQGQLAALPIQACIVSLKG